MTQSTDLVLSPNISGLSQRQELNDIIQAIATQHGGASRAAYLPAKSLWLKIISATNNELYFYDGISDVLMGVINSTTGQFTPSGQLAGFANSSDNKTANYTLASTDNGKIITVNATTAPFTLSVQSWATLPVGWFCILQKTDTSSNNVTIDPNASELVNNALTTTLNTVYQGSIIIRLNTTNTFSALLLPNAALYATINSPTFTGIPLAPTAPDGTNTTQIATTAFVKTNSGNTVVRTQTFAVGTTTYTPHANMIYCEVILRGGGGAGSGSGGAGAAGGISTFGSTLLQAPGGSGATAATGGAGGAPITAGAINIEGEYGGIGGAGRSGKGGDSPRGGYGGRAQITTGSGGTTIEAGKGPGAGGSGQGGNTAGIFYGGGGAGGFTIKSFTKTEIGASKVVVVGAGGTGGGGAGIAGECVILEYCSS